MKTNQVMTRHMGNFKVVQRTKDGRFNATMLLKQWNEAKGTKKEMRDYFDNKSTKEFIEALVKEDNLHGENYPYVKSKASRGENAGTWLNPIMFIDFCMWINPSFKVKVLKFVSDQMIKYRNEAGDAYRQLSSAVDKISTGNIVKDMKQVARAINYVVFGEHEHMMRNKHGEEDKQYELMDLEKKLADLINDGFINDMDGLICYLRKKWHEKYTPNVLKNN